MSQRGNDGAGLGLVRMLNPVSLFSRFRHAQIITVEPVIFLYMYSLYTMLFNGEQFFINVYGRREFISKGVVERNFSFNFCMDYDVIADRVGNKSVDEVETKTALLNVMVGIASQLPSVIPALILGPLSDRYGRRIIMFIAAGSGLLSSVGSLIVLYLNLPVELFVLSSFLYGIGGGLPGMLTAVFSYVVDISSSKWLTFRLGIVEAMIFIAGTISLSVGGYWLDKSACQFVDLAWLNFACFLSIIVYVLIFLPESLKKTVRLERAKKRGFGFGAVLRGGKILFTKASYSRWRIWFGLLLMALVYLVAIGGTSVVTLFLLHDPLKFKPNTIGLYQAVGSATHGLSLILLLPILVGIRLPDSLIVVIGLTIGFATTVAIGFVTNLWQIFLVGVIQGLEAIALPGIRSGISRAVSEKDQGAMFSIIAVAQVLASIVASVLFGTTYPKILKEGWRPGAIYWVMSLLIAIEIPFAIALTIFSKGKGATYKSGIVNAKDRNEGTTDTSVAVEESSSDSEESVNESKELIVSRGPEHNYYSSTDKVKES